MGYSLKPLEDVDLYNEKLPDGQKPKLTVPQLIGMIAPKHDQSDCDDLTLRNAVIQSTGRYKCTRCVLLLAAANGSFMSNVTFETAAFDTTVLDALENIRTAAKQLKTAQTAYDTIFNRMGS